MKLASVEMKGRPILAAQLDSHHLLDLSSAIRATERANFDTMLSFIEAGDGALRLARRAIASALQETSPFARIPISEVTWRAPVEKPGKIVCLALNNRANAQRILRGPEHPAFFLKPASALLGHEGAIACKPSYGRVHPEPELAVVIGAVAKSVTAAEAARHVFGFTIHNDITSPSMRGEDTFHYRAIHPRPGSPNEVAYVDSWVSYPGRYKGSDTFACMGPWLVTQDEIPDPHDLIVQCHHQGRLMTEDNTANLFHEVPEVISFVSNYMTLQAGDIVSMGTALQPSNSGGAVQNIDLNALGGPISVTIQGIGTLVNHVVHTEDARP